MDVFLYDETLGVTQKSLRALRDTIVDNYDHELEVWQVNAIDGIAYGFIIMDYTKELATITGDGFRSDGGGEGGAGHRAAQALLILFGLKPKPADTAMDYTENVEDYEDVVQDIPRVCPIVPKNTVPPYIDYMLRR